MDADAAGNAMEVEVRALPSHAFGSFVDAHRYAVASAAAFGAAPCAAGARKGLE